MIKTPQEFDSEEEAYVRAANEALATAAGLEARWWSYALSHRTFELVVGNPLDGGNVVLCLADCWHIAGPLGWEGQSLEVARRREDAGEWVARTFTLADRAAGFRAEGGRFRWARDYDLGRYGSLYSPRMPPERPGPAPRR